MLLSPAIPRHMRYRLGGSKPLILNWSNVRKLLIQRAVGIAIENLL